MIYQLYCEKIETLQKIDRTIFYALEKAIRSYRHLAQRHISTISPDITLDQWLVLKTIHEHPGLSQKELANMVFKDHASMTRMIDALVKKGFLQRQVHPEDRRRYDLSITDNGIELLGLLVPVVQTYRNQALNGINNEELKILQNILFRITENCATTKTSII